MGITQDGWFDWALRDPGPYDKVYSEPNLVEGDAFHSAVGYYQGWRQRLFSMERVPGDPTRYTPYAAASVTGFILYDGTLMQHYSIYKSVWANGNRHANVRLPAFEEEGGYAPHNEPLREAQIATSVRITRELSELKLWVPARDGQRTIWQHDECVAMWGGGATACPSNRIPHAEILRRLEVDDMVDQDLRAAMIVSGMLLHGRSCIERAGRIDDVNLQGALKGLLGPGPAKPVVGKDSAKEVLLYTASQAQQMRAANADASAMVRWLAQGYAP